MGKESIYNQILESSAKINLEQRKPKPEINSRNSIMEMIEDDYKDNYEPGFNYGWVEFMESLRNKNCLPILTRTRNYHYPVARWKFYEEAPDFSGNLIVTSINLYFASSVVSQEAHKKNKHRLEKLSQDRNIYSFLNRDLALKGIRKSFISGRVKPEDFSNHVINLYTSPDNVRYGRFEVRLHDLANKHKDLIRSISLNNPSNMFDMTDELLDCEEENHACYKKEEVGYKNLNQIYNSHIEYLRRKFHELDEINEVLIRSIPVQ